MWVEGVDKDTSSCQICHIPFSLEGVSKNEIIVNGAEISFRGAVICSDCWSFLISMTIEREQEFIDNRMRIAKIREGWKVAHPELYKK